MLLALSSFAAMFSAVSFADTPITIGMMFPQTPEPAAVVVLNEREPGTLLNLIRSLDQSGKGAVLIKHWMEDVSIACKTTGVVSSCTFSMKDSPRVSVDPKSRTFASPILPLKDFYGAEALLNYPDRTVSLVLHDQSGKRFNWIAGQGRFSIEGQDVK